MYILILIFAPALIMAAYIVWKSVCDSKSSRAQKEAQNAAVRWRLDLALKIADDFKRIGWYTWGAGAHLTDEQATRMKRAALSKTMKLIEYNPDSHCAIVQGEHGIFYHIDEFGYCSCPDCTERQLPCKHIYFAFLRIVEFQDCE